MPFMQPEIVKGQWVVIDGSNGITLYPFPDFSIDQAIFDYGKDGFCSVELVKGWAGRLSANGYTDATDWNGPFTHKKACVDSLRALYDDGEG